MILFLFADSLNYSMTPRVVHDEFISRAGEELAVVDIGKNDLNYIKKEISEAELIVFDNSIILAMTSGQILSRNVYFLNKKSADFHKEVWSIVNHSGKPVFLLAPMSDLHVVNFGLERQLFLEMINRYTGIFWQFYKCPIETDFTLDRYPYTTLEPFRLEKNDVINIWREITDTIKINIDFPNSISTSELIRKDTPKKWDLIVPGAAYTTRKLALASAEKCGLNITPYKKYYRWRINIPFYIYHKVTSNRFSAQYYQKRALKLYKYLINKSSVSFVCGSELKYNVRKYWEVPAWRSAMIAYPTHSLQNYGFEDGVQYLKAFPEEVCEKTKYLTNNKNVADKLVSKAYELIESKHTVKTRVDQVIACLNKFQKGALKGACYENGRFEIY